MSGNYVLNLCRLCLYKSPSLIDIYGVNGRHGYVAAEVIQDLLQITVNKCDGFPQNVCAVCLDKLTDFKVFKDQCLECKTSFEQEFSLPSYIQTRQTSVTPQESISSSAIKVEVKTEAEIIEIPADDLVTRELSPVSSELDVEIIDEDDDILYMDSGGRVDTSAVSNRLSNEWPVSVTGALNEVQHNAKRKQLKKKKKSKKNKKKDVSGAPVNQNGPNISTVPKEGIQSHVRKNVNHALTGDGRAAHGKTVRSESHNDEGRSRKIRRVAQGKTSVALSDTQSHATILQGLLDSVREKTLRNTHEWEPVSAVHHSGRERNSDKAIGAKTNNDLNPERHSTPSVGPFSSIHTTIVDRECHTSVNRVTSSEHYTLNKRNTHVFSYNEDNVLLSGENIQGYMNWRKWSPDRSQKKKKQDAKQRRSTDDKESLVSSKKDAKNVTQSSAVQKEIGDFNNQRVCADKSLDQIQNGINQSVDDPKKKQYNCHICGQSFTTRSSHANHRKTHPKMPFACELCDRTFFTLAKLNTHKFQHSGIRPFGCNICAKAFTRLSHLTRHLQTHTRLNEPL